MLFHENDPEFGSDIFSLKSGFKSLNETFCVVWNSFHFHSVILLHVCNH